MQQPLTAPPGVIKYSTECSVPYSVHRSSVFWCLLSFLKMDVEYFTSIGISFVCWPSKFGWRALVTVFVLLVLNQILNPATDTVEHTLDSPLPLVQRDYTDVTDWDSVGSALVLSFARHIHMQPPRLISLRGQGLRKPANLIVQSIIIKCDWRLISGHVRLFYKCTHTCTSLQMMKAWSHIARPVSTPVEVKAWFNSRKSCNLW